MNTKQNFLKVLKEKGYDLKKITCVSREDYMILNMSKGKFLIVEFDNNSNIIAMYV